MDSANKRKRNAGPKVRTGCGTCKQRHLKCDERKPTCLRCEKSGMKCLGYVDPSQKPIPQAKIPEIRRLLPRPIIPDSRSPSASPQAFSVLADTSVGVSIPSPPRLLPPGLFVGQDAIYFDFFRRQLIRDLAQLSSQSDFWTRRVLSQSMTDDCVRQSVLALGALSQALHCENSLLEQLPGRPSVSLPLSNQFFLNEHHEAAIARHVDAVSMFRKLFISGEPLARPSTVLIVTLLFIAFELLQGNMPAADNLMTGGIPSLRDYIRLHRRSSPRRPQLLLPQRGYGAADGTDDMDEMEFILPRLAVMSSYSPFCVSQYRHCSLVISGVEQPAADALGPPLWTVAGSLSTREVRGLWNEFQTRSMVFIIRAVGYKLHNLPYDIATTKRSQADFLGGLAAWRGYFLKFGENTAKQKPPSTTTTASRSDDGDADADAETFRLARIHLLFCRVFMECCLDASELSYDAFEPVFHELLTRCEAALPAAPPSRGGEMAAAAAAAVGLVPPLVFVAAKCRVRKIRMAAIKMLRRLPCREGTWDLKAIVAGQLAQVELEERGVEGAGVAKGTIPAMSRFVWSAGSWDAGRGRLRAIFTRAVPSEEGTPYRVEMELEI